jgi:DNA (cytosine-5)-methyltransferase 1
LESGRNLERPLPWNLTYQCNPRGRGNRESFLGVLNHIETEQGNPSLIATYLLYYDKFKQVSYDETVLPPSESKIAKIMRVFERHFSESSGQGKSRLPVLALYAVYAHLVDELTRYNGVTLLPLERHTTSDLRSGSIGDIQLNKGDLPFEGVEVKSDKPVVATMVSELLRKLRGIPVARYYILTTFPGSVLPADQESVDEAVKQVESITGCQIIVNGLIRTLWYYLRLLQDPSNVLNKYQQLLEQDEDVRTELKDRWNTIIYEEYPELQG